MSSDSSHPFKTLAVWACIIVGGLATTGIGLVCLVSIWEGFTHVHRPGSWVPIVAGTLVLGLAVWLYVRGTKAIHGRLDRDELLNF
ncbi:MAG: hypothetical protein K9N21_16945 [Deltaproteobacteria bacterium]|nr:hypothetical protein [Deltaproteobacteria bacterium]